MTKLVTNSNRLNAAEQIVESISEVSNTTYYVFVADHTDHANSTLQPVYDNESLTIDAYRNMIFGKRVEAADVKLMIRNIPYESDTVYAMYDDANNTILAEDFFVVVNAASTYHIYKCLDNNNGANSTIEPNFAHISGSNTYLYETSDGYRWKYMYSVDSANAVKFETSNFFPLIANTDVSGNAIQGAIDIIKVDGQGKKYDNYTSGTFSSSDIKIGGNTVLYSIGNNSASSVNGFYTDCLLYVSAGTGSGQYKTVTDYISNSSGKYIVANSEFATTLDNTSEYQIYPRVEIIGDGKQTVNAVARCLVNASSSNSIYRVEMLNRGAGYQYISANAIANAVVGVTSNAVLRGIYSPNGGHGFNAAEELGAKHVSFTVQVSNNESNTITVDNMFQQAGILKDPLFANVEIELKNANGLFTAGEQVYEINPIRINSNATINTTSAIVTCASADFEDQVQVGDWLYFKTSNGTSHQLGNVATVTNSSQIIMNVNGFFACTETLIYHANVTSNAWVMSTNATHTFLSNVSGQLVSNDIFIGINSGTRAQVNAVTRNDVSKNYDTFMQLYKYNGTLDSGSFTENEAVYQSNLTTSNALLHSAVVDGSNVTLYTSNQVGQFVTGGNNIIGNTSGAIASIDEAFSPELVFESGEILFLENLEEITRSANTNETFQIIFEF